ncbi:hypothetical protein U9M48_001796 [Paspalum notatum var. saurae]|uniref:Reverse transcriptase domain-containing protein n=1 Tax=Paspalum notatum var. saurae TaxID=547442 RepID=A0AAQ3PQ37_PASNO
MLRGKGKKDKVWGPIVVERKSKRNLTGGRTVLEKAQDLKMKSNLETGKDKRTGFSWKLVVIYGSPYEEGKQDFLDELEMVAGELDISRLNFALITLIPKVEEASNMRNFRPISLINCSFKMISKLLTIRFGKVMQRLIAPNQSAFIKNRYILESVAAAHEIIHSVHKERTPGLVLKLDFEKAYDKVSWDFLFEVLESRGFHEIWISWIKKLVMGGSIGVVLNGEDSSFFKTGKGLSQGDPISPLLFNLVVDVLTRMMSKSSEASMICGLFMQMIQSFFSSLNKEHLINLKCIRVWFERISGMSINFHKSEIVALNSDNQTIHVPLHHEKLSREDLQPLVDKVLKRVAGWRGIFLSHAARLVLIKSCLSSIPIYLLSFIKFPKWAIKLINAQLANCLWNDVEGNRKYHLVNWEKNSYVQRFCGLGVQNLRDLNVCLLGSWIKRYLSSEDKLWRELLDFKYKTKHPNILAVKDLGGSQFFKSFVYAVKAARMGFRWKIGDGKRVKFWEDNWLGTSSLATQFWDLYVLVNKKSGTVAELWDGENLKCTFRRTVSEEMFNSWLEVVQLATTIVLTQDEDSLIWQFTSSRVYSSQSLYKLVNFRGVHPVLVPSLWDVKVPPRVHFFLWLLANNRVLTRENLKYGYADDGDLEDDPKLDSALPRGPKTGAVWPFGVAEEDNQYRCG